MAFIDTIAKADATDATKAMYDAAEASAGFLPHYAELFGHRPDVYAAWQGLMSTIRKHMRLRRYELVTLAAARELGCTYCMLAHGEVILKANEVDGAQLIAIADDYREANLAPDEVAVMDYVTKVIRHASSVTQADIDSLRAVGLSDAEILDVTLAAAARSFFSKTLDALAAEPDAKYQSLSPALRAALVVGRPFLGE